MKLLIVIDMQNDFIDGSLGSPEAVSIVPMVKTKIEEFKLAGHKIVFTADTHYDDYLTTQEGRYLPVVHCVKGTEGHRISKELCTENCTVLEKGTFGTLQLAEIAELIKNLDEIELCGLCTDICVVTNALILKTRFPELKISVDATCCAGVTKESHTAALKTMKMCQVNVYNDNEVRL
jgi:nicotinamidase-related amidase